MVIRSAIRRGASAFLLLAAWGCTDDIAAPRSEPVDAQPSTAAGSQQEDVQTITHAVARSLEDPRLRQRLLEDLRDSPNPQHKLHLKSYLSGPEGGVLLSAGADRGGKSRKELQKLLQNLPEMELVVPRRFDRVTWTGSDDLVVFGTARSPRDVGREGGSLRGYTPSGDSATISVFAAPQYVMIMLRPQEHSFGPDPEALRTAVPNRSRNTISKREVEFSLDPTVPDLECTGPGCSGGASPGDATATCIGCTPGGPQAIPEGGLDLGFSYSYCTSPSGDDADQDGVRDGCEELIAQRFSPVLRIDQNDRCPGREPHWSVARWSGPIGSAGSVKIMYLLSYYLDCPNSALLWGNTGHDGDSEWIIHTVTTYSQAPTRWYSYSVTTSAHYGEQTDATNTTDYGSWPEYAYGYRIAPVVWVALDKHANYSSRGACEDGAIWWDSCGYPWRDERVQVLSDAEANVGNNWSDPAAVRLKDLVQSRYPSEIGFETERIWGSMHQRVVPHLAEQFCGWYPYSGSRSCASGYARPVYEYAF